MMRLRPGWASPASISLCPTWRAPTLGGGLTWAPPASSLRPSRPGRGQRWAATTHPWRDPGPRSQPPPRSSDPTPQSASTASWALTYRDPGTQPSSPRPHSEVSVTVPAAQTRAQACSVWAHWRHTVTSTDVRLLSMVSIYNRIMSVPATINNQIVSMFNI